MDIAHTQLINATAVVNSYRHQVPLAAYRERLARNDAQEYAQEKAYCEAKLAAARVQQGAALLGLLTSGLSHRKVLQIVRGLKC